MFFHQRNLKKSIINLLNQLNNSLPLKDIEIVYEYIEYNEFGIGFEHICTQLFEYETQISPEIYQQIENIGESMEMDEKDWSDLKTLVRND